ncbi:universal stress protein [Nonomuraea candida]|uniref:universal stress protein n=1 Tax=Nonomuraea candida TaxID=359159 RepID=UPI0005BB1B3A|nr:universal stress protein [Nonomuraea candida]
MIIVGVDGSRTGLEAAGWAASEAALRGSPLTVAHAVPKWLCEEGAVHHYAEVARWMRGGAESVLTSATERIRRDFPQVRVESVLLPGDPRSALLKASEEAELLVVGSGGIGGVRGLLVGSVAYGVAAHARTDLVLIHEPPETPRGEVVVGTDGSRGATRALEFAFAEAGLRGARLRAVQAWAWPQPGGFEPASREHEQETLRTLKASLTPHRERHPGVHVVAEVVHGHPVEVLKEAGADADLLVVGSRGHGQLAGMLIGSISQALLHHAPCPLAVIRRAPSHA